MATHKLSILVEAIGTAKAAKNLKGIDKTISSIGGRSGKGIRTAADNIKTLGLAAGGIAVAGIAGAVKVAADFESQLNTINTIARATPKELDVIGSSIRQLARQTGKPLEELTQGYYDLLSAGIASSDAQAVLTQANTLAIGGLASTAETVDLLTTAINTYGGDASKAGVYTDQFAKAIERGKVTAAELSQSFATVGQTAAANGISIDEIAASYARLTSTGVPAAEAATQMRSAIVSLTRRTGDLKKLEKQTGKNYLSIAGSKGLVVALEEMRKDAAKAGVPLINLLGRVEGVNFALATTGPNFDDYNADLAAMGEASGTAAGQMAERQKGLNFQLDRLKALARDAGITIGSKLLPKLTPLAEKAVAFLDTHQGDIERFGDSIARGFDKALEFAQKIPWGAVGSGLQTAATWAGKLMDVFLGMPKEAQTTLIALAGLNKLSGGAISGIVGELGKGLIKGVLGMTAGVVNIKAGVVTGGGAPGASGPGGATGLLALLGPALAGVAVAGASHGVTQDFNKQSGANFMAPGSGGIGGGIITGLHNLGEVFKLYAERKTPEEIAQAEGQRQRDARASLQAQREGERSAKAGSLRIIESTRAKLDATNRVLSDVGLKTQRAGERTAGAIRAKDFSVRVNTTNIVNVRTTVTAAAVRNRVAYHQRIGKSNGSFGGGTGVGHL